MYPKRQSEETVKSQTYLVFFFIDRIIVQFGFFRVILGFPFGRAIEHSKAIR